MCLGMNPDQLAPGERCASTSNRNFEGRQGKGGRTHLVSPLVAAATAMRGTLSSPSDLDRRRTRGHTHLCTRQAGGLTMEKFVTHTGIAAPLKRSNVDTDQIIPAVYLKRVTKTGFEDALFAAWRQDPEFVLNQAAFQGASILVAGPDFGTGSSREHAVWALRDFGFTVVLSPEFADIFRGNSGKQGLLTGAISEEDLERIWAEIDAEPGIEHDRRPRGANRLDRRHRGRLSRSMITLGGGFSKGSMTSGSRCATKTRSRSSRLAARRGGRGPCLFQTRRFRGSGTPQEGGPLSPFPRHTQVRFTG